jgi:glucose/arabinose dehydrogenase
VLAPQGARFGKDEHMRLNRRRSAVLVAVAAGALTISCAGPAETTEPAAATSAPTQATTSWTATPSPSPTPSSTPDTATRPIPPAPIGPPPQVGTVEVILTHLEMPWGLAVLPDRSILITERETANVLWYPGSGTEAVVVEGDGAAWLRTTTTPTNEGGLLGITYDPATVTAATADVFVFHTTATGNAVARLALTGLDTGAPQLSGATTILAGIPRGQHNYGGAIAFGPDGYLYVATGDAEEPDLAQIPSSLAGKILRITADGNPAPGNPWGDTPQWAIGLRDVKGLSWSDDGVMYAADLGPGTWDELNIVTPGANFGWPTVEGISEDPRFVDPVFVWDPAEAAPSGVAVTNTAIYVATTRGERLWQVPLGNEDMRQMLVDEYGRLQAVVAEGDDTLWVLTGNLDGGTPAVDDDSLLLVEMRPITP